MGSFGPEAWEECWPRVCISKCPRKEPDGKSDVVVEAPSCDSEEPGIRHGLVWEAIEELRKRLLGPKAEEGSDIWQINLPYNLSRMVRLLPSQERPHGRGASTGWRYADAQIQYVGCRLGKKIRE